jgi:CDP-diacylglycerol pyrophosphatase
MANNSAASRSQDQLHVHVACIAPAVANFLRRHQAEIHEAWSFLSSALLGHRFAAMKVETDNLVHVDPFKLLAHGLPSAKFSMGRQTLAVTYDIPRRGTRVVCQKIETGPAVGKCRSD